MHATGTSLDRRPSSPTPDPSQADERTDLGLTALIQPAIDPAQVGASHQHRFFLVPADDTARLNDGPLPGEMPQAGPGGVPAKAKPSSLPAGPEGFFGLALETRWGALGGVFGTAEEERLGRRFVGFEPCRVAVEFWRVDELRDKQRLYSRTWFYQGSAYNLYLQRVTKKQQNQLGIYLHRQNPHEPFPAASQPPGGAGARAAEAVALAQGGMGNGQVDKRTKIQAYFSIWCPNQLGMLGLGRGCCYPSCSGENGWGCPDSLRFVFAGTALTKFSSGPDAFALSQSWGWKSSSLRSAEYVGGREVDGSAPGLEGGLADLGQEGAQFSSLRVCVVLGLV